MITALFRIGIPYLLIIWKIKNLGIYLIILLRNYPRNTGLFFYLGMLKGYLPKKLLKLLKFQSLLLNPDFTGQELF